MASPCSESAADLNPEGIHRLPSYADHESARDYIADMATELSALAASAGEVRLAEALGRAAELARGAS